MKLQKLFTLLTIAFLSVATLVLSILLYARYLYPEADYTQIILTIYNLTPDIIQESIYPTDYVYALLFFIIIWPLCYLYLSTKKQFYIATIMSLLAIYFLGWPEYFILSHTTSTLYEEHYVAPSKKISAPEQKRNLILIYLESFEQNYAKSEHYGTNLISQLHKLQTTDNHSLDYRALNSTNYSIGALVASHCGIPLVFTQERDMYVNTFFLPEATCFPEILKANGYQTRILKAADIHFTNADNFAKNHGYEIAWGKDQILAQYPEFQAKKYQGTFGGLTDRALYEVAQKELATFSPDRPFLLTLFSLDTHTPSSHIDPSCARQYKDLRDAYICADAAVDEFIAWLKTSPYWQNTTVIIVGDHLLPSKFKAKGRPKRSIFNVFLNLPENLKLTTSKTFTALDIPASILESLNFKLEDHAFGLGRSIFANTPPLIDTMGNKLNKRLMQHSEIYDRLSNPPTKHVATYTPYTLNTILDNKACTQYTDITENIINLYYLDRLNFVLEDLPTNAKTLKMRLKFNTIFSRTGALSIFANGTNLLQYRPQKGTQSPYYLEIDIPIALISDNKLQLKFHNNSNTRNIISLGIAPLAISISTK